MPNTQSSAGKSTPPIERRLCKRHRPSTLAYLDIGTDNGGIVLDLCEQGIGFQAVAPLDVQQDLHLSIKAPDSRTKIEATARIVWLNKTSRQAGVRLLDLPVGNQLRIQNWIQSLAAPLAPLEESEAQREVVNKPPRKPEPIKGVRGKWLSLMPEFDASKFASEEATEAGGVNSSKGSPTFNTPEGSQESRLGSGKRDEIWKELPAKALASGAGPGVRETDGGSAIASSNPESDTRENASAGCRGVGADPVPADFTPSIRAEEVVSPEARSPLPESSNPSSPAVFPDVDSAPNLLTAPPEAARITYLSGIRNRVVKPVIFALCAAIFFGVGTWVGHLISGRHNFGGLRVDPTPAAQTARGKTAQQQTINPAINQTTTRGSAQVESAPRDKGHPQQTPKHAVFEDRKASPSPQLVAVPSANESSPPEPDLATPQSTPQLAGMPIASPAPPDSPVPAAGPRIVAGRELKPSDRFNPPHLTYRVEPEYPPQALQQGIEGIVKIRLGIGSDGNVQTVKPLSGPPLLTPAALEAVRYWRYFPALLNGQPVESELEIIIEFRLPH